MFGLKVLRSDCKINVFSKMYQYVILKLSNIGWDEAMLLKLYFYKWIVFLIQVHLKSDKTLKTWSAIHMGDFFIFTKVIF